MSNIKNGGEMKFSAFLQQIQSCANQKLYYVAIMTSLAVPDIGGAIDSNDGKANKKKYINWFDGYAAPKFIPSGRNLTGEECYYLRCSMVHQGRVQPTKLKRYSDIILCEFPQSDAPINPLFLTTKNVLLIEPKTFINNIVNAAYDWLEEKYDDEHFKVNTEKLLTIFSLSFPDVP
jgi:hypothetical protein